MSRFYTLWLLLLCAPALKNAQFSGSLDVDRLPEPDECGTLKPDQLYNLEKLSDSDEFPWMARLRYNFSDFITYNNCLAVLISKRFLITAAHCLQDTAPDAVKFGDCEEKCTIIKHIDRLIVHPKYVTGVIENDIGLIRLKQPIRYAYYMRPICLPNADLSEEGFVAQHLMSTGIVRNSRESNKRFLLVVDLDHCRRIFFRNVLDDSLLCANTCDNGSRFISGSALMAVNATRNKASNYYFVGLLTFGLNVCVDYTPDIFQRIDVYVDWIRSIVER